MKFVSMPKNGSSWRGRLPYSFSIESDEPQDVTVEILNYVTGDLLGTMRLYGVVDGEVDIAPYVRPHVSMKLVETTELAKLFVSPSSISVIVRIDGIDSEVRVFFRSEFDNSVIGPISSKAETSIVLQGEAIRITLFAKMRIDVTLIFSGRTTSTHRYDTLSHGMPVELVVQTKSVSEFEELSINVRCDAKNLFVFNYTIMQRTGTPQRVVWYNKNGGVESYLFDHAKRLSYEVKRENGCLCDEGCMILDGRVRYRLCSGYELQTEMERVAQLMLSPIVCRESDGMCREVELDSREITFDSKGMLRSMTLDLSEKWEGGELLW